LTTVEPQQPESYLTGWVSIAEQARRAAGCLDFATSTGPCSENAQHELQHGLAATDEICALDAVITRKTTTRESTNP
jgi:hypothetical protein